MTLVSWIFLQQHYINLKPFAMLFCLSSNQSEIISKQMTIQVDYIFIKKELAK